MTRGFLGGDVRLWHEDVRRRLDEALTSARSGRSTVMLIEGEPGSGKTTLLDELAERADGFRVLAAEGLPGECFAYSVLLQWGVDLPHDSPGGPIAPFLAAQRLREHLNRVAFDRPVLLRVDDLQWADDESISALSWLVGRATDDQLLVAVGARPGLRGAAPRWQRLRTGSGLFVRIELSGLSIDQIETLLTARGQKLSRDAAVALHRHTDGNPLYVTALLDEHDPADLAARQSLPAPAAFAATVAQRTARLSEPALALLRLCAVWGADWHSLRDVAGLSTADPSEAIEVLVEQGLLAVRSEPGAVRVTHALVRAAVYEQTPLALRRDLHHQIAKVLTDRGEVLGQRLAASSSYDDQLAGDLDAYAQSLRRRRAWQRSARYLRGASDLTTDPGHRRRRLLESLMDHALSSDPAVVHAELAGSDGADDPAALVVLAVIRLAAHQFEEVEGMLGRVLHTPGLDNLTAHRAGVLLAFAMLRTSRPASEVHEVLGAAEDLGINDPCVFYHARLVRTMADHLRMSPAQQWRTLDPALSDAAAVPVEASYELARRAIVAVRAGLFDIARSDLQEVMRRFRGGELTGADGRIPLGLGFVQWLLGDWTNARISMHLGMELDPDPVYPLYLLLGDGRFDEMDRAMAPLVEQMRQGRAAGDSNLTHLMVLRAHAEGDRDRMRGVGRAELPSIEAVLAGSYRPTALWLLSAGVAATWAGATHHTRTCAEELVRLDPLPAWAPACASWLRALASEQEGDVPGAVRAMEPALRDPGMNLPLFRAHMHVDQARMVSPDRARPLLQEALAAYRRLGATPYVHQIRQRLAEPVPVAAPAFVVTDRERDVLSLTVSGMSYAQIADELFITRKTVGYHLSNLYAKVGVTGRHELADLARRQPELFRPVPA
ncbi:hypothetical protein FJK98_21565 [Micromonospora sp. HM134]|nr:hypothetical protein FJK98_21565 [Micromonospora sp. HM134]